MKRLTPANINSVCYDPWELCGLDRVCKRDCFKPEPCKIPKIIYRLADYENTGLEPEEVTAKSKWADDVCRKLQSVFGDVGVFDFDHLCKLIEAEKEERVVILPCKRGDAYYHRESCRGQLELNIELHGGQPDGKYRESDLCASWE